MTKRLLFAIGGAISLLPFFSWAYTAPPDSLQIQQLQAVTVLGTKPQDFAAGCRVLTISPQILGFQQGTLSDLLNQYAPLYVRQYGMSGIATVSFRGTNPEHTAVLWNGLNVNSPTLGQSDLAILPTFAATEVSLRAGGASANYGTAAMGGVVLLNNPTVFRRKNLLQIQQEVGSFGLNKTSGQYHFYHKNLASQTTIFQNSQTNDFEFKDLAQYGTPTVRQQNAAVHQWGFTQNLAYQFRNLSSLALKTLYTDSYRQVQPSMGSANTNAKMLDNTTRLLLEYCLPKSTHKTMAKLAFFNDYLFYTDDSQRKGSNTQAQTYQTQVEHTRQFGQKLMVQLGGEVQYFLADVDGYGTDTKKQWRSAVFALLKYLPTEKLQVSTNFRYALVQDYQPAFAPNLGVAYHLVWQNRQQLTLKGNAAINYRVPTLNERFWVNSGNPNLLTEKGYSSEIGLQYTYLWNENHRLNAEITGYYSLIDNFIRWTPQAGTGIWRPENLAQVNNKGIEFSVNHAYKVGKWALSSSVFYQYTQSVQTQSNFAEQVNKQLSYVPLHAGGANLIASFKNWTLHSSFTYTGKRYYLLDNSKSLDAYLLCNLLVSKQFNFQFGYIALQARINNLLDTTYQNVEFRAMPYRNYAFTVRVGF